MTAFWLLLGGLTLIFVFLSLYVDGRWHPDESRMNPAGRKAYRIWHNGLARLKSLLYRAAVGATICLMLWVGIEKAALLMTPTSKVGYFLEFAIAGDTRWTTPNYEQVVINPRPHDCEWGTAPIGNKNCHYSANVQSVYTATSSDGTPLVSYDEGKTSSVNANHVEPSVFVSWTKVED